MKDLTKYFIDLSKCTEQQRKHIFSLLPEQEFDNQYRIDRCHFHLSFDENDHQWWVYNSTVGKTELTYPEFIQLFEGGEGERKTRIEMMSDDELAEELRESKSHFESLEYTISSIEREMFYRANPELPKF